MAEKLRLRGLVGCYALFQYLTVSVQAANAVYTQVREKMEELHRTLTAEQQLNSSKEGKLARADADSNRPCVSRVAAECEALAWQQVALLKYHNTVAVFPLVTLRQTLTSALPVWTTSVPLWSIYVQVRLIKAHFPPFFSRYVSQSLLSPNLICLFWPD